MDIYFKWIETSLECLSLLTKRIILSIVEFQRMFTPERTLRIFLHAFNPDFYWNYYTYLH